jgi:hypothetical protein
MKIILNLVTLRSRHLIAPIIPIVCARLSTSPNPNSTISKRRISQLILITFKMGQIAAKNIIIQKSTDLQNLLQIIRILKHMRKQ